MCCGELYWQAVHRIVVDADGGADLAAVPPPVSLAPDAAVDESKDEDEGKSGGFNE